MTAARSKTFVIIRISVSRTEAGAALMSADPSCQALGTHSYCQTLVWEERDELDYSDNLWGRASTGYSYGEQIEMGLAT
jgi:hypothetical protein